MSLKTPGTYKNIISLLDYNSDKNLLLLKDEYQVCLTSKDISDNAKILTQTIIESCSNALDQIAYLVWFQRISPIIANAKQNQIYFPIATDSHSYKSTIGKWHPSLQSIDPDLDAALKKFQPYLNQKYQWLQTLRAIANNKHTGITPQIKHEEKTVTVSNNQGSVSWGSGVHFRSGVSIMGVPIDEKTQLPIPTSTTTTKIDTWVYFMIEGTNINALTFCENALLNTKEIVEELYQITV